MSRKEFNELFDEWAPHYDKTVTDTEGEYNEVFENYPNVLAQVVRHIPEHAKQVLEFGVGTGNLSQQLVQAGYHVIGVEPSIEMRKIVERKEINIDIRGGHFLDIPLREEEKVDAIVSSYAFHHLPLEDKRLAIQNMKSLLQPNGSIVFADTAFKNEQEKKSLLERVQQQGKLNLYTDLRSEYYELVDDLIKVYKAVGFEVHFTPLNRFVWLSVATLN